MLLLAMVETRRPTGRRFGAEAEARWSSFAGHLDARDRIDILVRDADLEWPGALGARRVFGLDGVADDDAFGAGWEGVAPAVASEVLRAHSTRSFSDVAGWLDAAFVARRRPRSSVEFDRSAALPNARFVAVGASAVAELLLAFEGRTDLDFGQQVAVVADDAFARQLAAAAPVVLASGTPAMLVGSHELHARDGLHDVAFVAKLREWKGALLVTSPEGEELDRARASDLALGRLELSSATNGAA